MGKLIAILIPFLAILLGGAAYADQNGRDVPPHSAVAAVDQAQSCLELDAEINRLMPLTYPSNPVFYADPAHGMAIWSSVFWAPALSYLGYSGVADYYDRQGMAEAERRIAMLRHLKARRRCYQR